MPRFDDRCPPVCATRSEQERAQLAREVAQLRRGRAAAGRRDCRSFEQRIHASYQLLRVGRSSRRARAGAARAPPNGASARVRLVAQRFGVPLRFGEPEQRDVRRLVLRGVLAGGLAERRRRSFDVEHVVDDLEREARRAARRRRARASSSRPSGPRRTRRPGAPPRGSARPSSSGASCSSSGSDIATPTCARSIAWPPAMPGAPAACASSAHALPRVAQRRDREHGERLRLQRVAGEQRASPRRTRRGTSACRGEATSSSMHGRSSCTSEYAWIISTAAAGPSTAAGSASAQLAGGVGEQRPHALAAAQHRVAHRLDQRAPACPPPNVSARSSTSSMRRCRSPRPDCEGEIRVHRRRRRARTPSARPFPGSRSAAARPSAPPGRTRPARRRACRRRATPASGSWPPSIEATMRFELGERGFETCGVVAGLVMVRDMAGPACETLACAGTPHGACRTADDCAER